MGAAAAANTPAAGDEPTANPVWPSKRIAEVMAPEAGGDLSGGAKRKRQATARLQEDADQKAERKKRKAEEKKRKKEELLGKVNEEDKKHKALMRSMSKKRVDAKVRTAVLYWWLPSPS